MLRISGRGNDGGLCCTKKKKFMTSLVIGVHHLRRRRFRSLTVNLDVKREEGVGVSFWLLTSFLFLGRAQL